MKLNNLKNKTIHIIGLSGTEGSSLALFFISQRFNDLVGHDFSTKRNFTDNYYYYHQNQPKEQTADQLKKIKKAIKINYQDNYLKNIQAADYIFLPSSWFRYKENSTLITKPNLFNWYNLALNLYPGTIIGVSGTAGKGTTTHLIYNILKAAGKKVYLAGDAWEMFDFQKYFKAGNKSFLVLELSNRTLTFAKQSKKCPAISVITNVTKHHLDDHDNSFIKYVKVKKEIGNYQKPGDYLLYCDDDQYAKKFAKVGKGRHLPFSYAKPEIKLIKNNALIGKHLVTDAVAAVKVGKILNITEKAINKGLNDFKPRSGRMQLVKKINGVLFINDGSSTRPQATIAAIKSFPQGKVNLILEGCRTKPDLSFYHELLSAIDDYRVKNISVSGKITDFILPQLKKTSAKIFTADKLGDSVKLLFKSSKPGDVILLSPANESFGEFKDYRERVESFNTAVKNLK